LSLKRVSLIFVIIVLFLSGCAGLEGELPKGEQELEELPEISLLVSDYESDRLYAQVFQEMFKENLGVDVVINSVDPKTYMELLGKGDFSMHYIGWSGDYNDPLTFLDLWVTNAPFNTTGWSNKDYDELINAARTTLDPQERLDSLLAAENLLLEEAPIAPIFWPVRNYLDQEYVFDLARPPVGPATEYKWAYTEGKPEGDGILNINLSDDPATLDPHHSYDIISREVINAVFEGLVRMDKDGNIKKGSGLAEDWTISDDGLTITFTLRPAYWSDGKQITASDFEFAWKRAIDPRTASPHGEKFYPIAGAKEANLTPLFDEEGNELDGAGEEIEAALKKVGIKAKDSRTLEVNLAQTTPHFIDLIALPAFYPLPQHFLESTEEPFAEPENAVYNGPFVLNEWRYGDLITLSKNKQYWDKQNVRLEKINFFMIKDQKTTLALFDQGKLDTINVPGTFFSEYRDKGLESFPEAALYYLGFNLQEPLFANAKVRLAFSLSLDRQSFAEYTLQDGSLPTTSVTPPRITSPLGTSFQSLLKHSLPSQGDANKARKLFEEGLEELGYKITP
jgi:ABC-type oligopeptide transport system substrate-binding subunit